jgi:hypothetical protein
VVVEMFLALPYLALPCLALPCLTLPYLVTIGMDDGVQCTTMPACYACMTYF